MIPTEGLNDNVVESNGELLKETNDDNNDETNDETNDDNNDETNGETNDETKNEFKIEYNCDDYDEYDEHSEHSERDEYQDNNEIKNNNNIVIDIDNETVNDNFNNIDNIDNIDNDNLSVFSFSNIDNCNVVDQNLIIKKEFYKLKFDRESKIKKLNNQIANLKHENGLKVEHEKEITKKEKR